MLFEEHKLPKNTNISPLFIEEHKKLCIRGCLVFFVGRVFFGLFKIVECRRQ